MPGAPFSTVRVTETGEQDPDVGNKYLYASRLERNEAGVWQTVDYTVDDGGSACP
jgi:hypothetical protein